MKIIKQLCLIFGMCLVGVAISSVLPFTFPSSLISMLLLLLLLITKCIKPASIKETSEFLLSSMAFFFVPSGVAIIEQYSFLKGKIAVLILICIVTTILTFLTTTFTVTMIIKYMNKGAKSNELDPK
ncbi:CidA/LrgA family protein [Anaerosporobacter faecicola]|uniref:CidA/LrgA family protein n=1 Tax=Anaerosporobacter faecicola TaxID=2718714 RepID=UPI00143BCB94|nr:CidA/LrgA family protein [Anaerosporobacter faecicola]